jgi:putative hydrolase of the HAD superfamily
VTQPGMGRGDLPPAMMIDMDDTILTLTETSVRCWGELCINYADRMPVLETQAMLDTLDRVRADFWRDPERHRSSRLDLHGSRRTIIERFLTQIGPLDAALVPGLADEMALSFTESHLGTLTAFPGAIEAVRELRMRGVKLALITNGEGHEQRRKIDRFELAPLFDCVVVEGEFGKGKPEPEVYYHALNALGVRPDEAWMVGDNFEWEVVVPKQLGIYSVWVDFARKGLPADAPVQPDRIIHNLAELVA